MARGRPGPAAGVSVPGTTPQSHAAHVVRSLELVVRRRVEGRFHGAHAGLSLGPGSEPGECRLYRPGDDVRLMDWNVTARTLEPHVRDPIADRELELWLAVDLSASLDFGTARCEKRDLAVSAAACLALSASKHANRIAAVVLDGTQVTPSPARSGRHHTSSLVHRLVEHPRGRVGARTDLAGSLVAVDRMARRRGMVAVISDFLATPGWERPLGALAQRHELLAIEVVDPRELHLPDVGPLLLTDAETGQTREIDTGSSRLRRRYAAAAAKQRSDIADSIRRAGAEHLVLRTDGDWVRELADFFRNRRRARRATAWRT